MKKFSIVLIALFAIMGQLKAQTISVNAYGGYTFDENLNFDNAYAKIKSGFMWGVSAEGIGPRGGALELLYQYQATNVPVYSNTTGLLNPDENSGVISYLLLNANQYFKINPTVQPYVGLGAGAAFISEHAGNSATKFAWDAKTGLKIKATKSVAFKIGAQLLSSVHQSGTYYYYYYGRPYAYAAYSNVFQFGFTGGITYDFGR